GSSTRPTAISTTTTPAPTTKVMTTKAPPPMIGVDRVTEFVEWLDEKGAKGFIGEYGVPGNDSRWLTVLDNFLAYLDANGVSGTYWAGGPWWGSYQLSCEPTNNYTTDKPQMSVLEDYN